MRVIMRVRFTSTWRIQIINLILFIFFLFLWSRVQQIQIKKKKLRISTLYQLLCYMLWEGDRYVCQGEKIRPIPKKLTVEQRWCTHTHKTWYCTRLTVMKFPNRTKEKMQWEPKKKKVHWSLKMNRPCKECHLNWALEDEAIQIQWYLRFRT